MRMMTNTEKRKLLMELLNKLGKEKFTITTSSEKLIVVKWEKIEQTLVSLSQ